MKFTKEKIESIKHYILEKIEEHSHGIARLAAENFDINQNTVHTFIKELISENVIEKVKRDEYRLVVKEFKYELNRNDKSLSDDMYAYKNYISPLLEGMTKNVNQIWAYVIGEMVNNVIDHSESETAEIKIIQNYLSTKVILTDYGIGIFRKIQEYFGYESLDDAIIELFKGKLTTDSQNHSGEGIFFSSRLMDRFCVISDGKIFKTGRFDEDVIKNMLGTESKGTSVFMELSNFSNKTAKEIFDIYTDDNYSFSKTRIPVKNLFDDIPVSRSQAKRLCNRLEKFSEITVDFEGVEWMGQGFAHQLFVVFTNEHANINVIPTNMNEDVENMYKHVMNSNDVTGKFS